MKPNRSREQWLVVSLGLGRGQLRYRCRVYEYWMLKDQLYFDAANPRHPLTAIGCRVLIAQAFFQLMFHCGTHWVSEFLCRRFKGGKR